LVIGNVYWLFVMDIV